MRLSSLIILGVLVSSFSLTSISTYAADGDRPKPPGERDGERPKRGERDGERPKRGEGDRPIPPEILEKFDADKDGKLNEDERKAAREAHLKEFDKDGDGKLSEEERKAAHDAREAKMLEKFDKDGDGKLSEEEKKDMPPPPPRGGPRDGEGKGPRGERDKGKGPRPDGDKGGRPPGGGDKPQPKP